MAKYFYTSGKRKGKVYQEFYYSLNGQQIVNKKTNYCPVNTKWLSKEEFKQYVLSLIEGEFPQIYVLEELPEELFTYALVFVQNNQGTRVYLDKEEVRTEIRLSGDFDAVNVVNSLPENLQNNVIYFSKNKAEEDEVEQQNINIQKQKSYIYVHENNSTKQIIPQVSDLVPEECIKTGYIISEIENTKTYYGFISVDFERDIVFLDDVTEYTPHHVYIAELKDNVIVSILSESQSDVYFDGLSFHYEGREYERYYYVDQDFPILATSIAYSSAIKSYVDTKTSPINDLTTKSLKNIYNQTLSANKNVITDANGYLTTGDGAHLYLHHYRYARQARGDVNLYIYTTSSTELNNTQLGDYIYNLGCNARWCIFPACGEAQYSNAMVDGMYATLNSGGLVKYNFHVVSHNGSNEYDELVANYTHSYSFIKIQIF